MSRISFLNHKFLPHEQAFVHIEDRGFQFADGIYEVILFYNGKLIDSDRHFERLFRSLKEIDLKFSLSQQELEKIIGELFAQNHLKIGSVYLQITRGSSPRSQTFPANYIPTIIATVSPLKTLSQEELENGTSMMTDQDIRWGRCDIKSVGLLASTMIRQKAASLGFDDVIFIRNNQVTECSFSNIFMVNQAGTIITADSDHQILNGITRRRIIDLAKENGLKVEERKFSVDELMQATEVFSTSTTLLVRPVVKIDGKNIGLGKVGEVTKKLINYYNLFGNFS